MMRTAVQSTRIGRALSIAGAFRSCRLAIPILSICRGRCVQESRELRQPRATIGAGWNRLAFAALARQFGHRTADLVAAVTNPVYAPGRDEHEQYREHVAASLLASPWARVIKASDFTDNAVGLIHSTGPKLSTLARKYRPLVPVLRELILRPDTPLDSDVKQMIAGQLDNAEDRFAAICEDHDADRAQG
jgi:hypothetical protein